MDVIPRLPSGQIIKTINKNSNTTLYIAKQGKNVSENTRHMGTHDIEYWISGDNLTSRWYLTTLNTGTKEFLGDLKINIFWPHNEISSFFTLNSYSITINEPIKPVTFSWNYFRSSSTDNSLRTCFNFDFRFSFGYTSSSAAAFPTYVSDSNASISLSNILPAKQFTESASVSYTTDSDITLIDSNKNRLNTGSVFIANTDNSVIRITLYSSSSSLQDLRLPKGSVIFYCRFAEEEQIFRNIWHKQQEYEMYGYSDEVQRISTFIDAYTNVISNIPSSSTLNGHWHIYIPYNNTSLQLSSSNYSLLGPVDITYTDGFSQNTRHITMSSLNSENNYSYNTQDICTSRNFKRGNYYNTVGRYPTGLDIIVTNSDIEYGIMVENQLTNTPMESASDSQFLSDGADMIFIKNTELKIVAANSDFTIINYSANFS